VIAPHPFFPSLSCLGRRLAEHESLFDAVEYNGMFTARVNFNERARRWAVGRDKPIVGNGDVHRLEQLGTTYSLVDSEPDADAICDAIRAGKVRVKARPHSAVTAARLILDLFGSNLRRDRWTHQASPDAAY
jgi:predicted metal-dependent phosphoesterase TrpH